MRKLKYVGLLVLGLLLGANANAQGDIDQLLKFMNEAKGDVQLISNAYLESLGKSIGRGFNNGWYTTAHAHKLGGFDLTISANAVLINSSMKTFDLNSLKMEKLEVDPSSSPITPTALGKDVDGSIVRLKNFPSEKLQLPGGSGIPVVPLPMYNIGIGLPFHTEISARFIPTVKFGDGKAGLWGVALKNEFKEFIPVFKMLPFSVSAFYGITKYNLEWDMTNGDYSDKSYNDQKLKSDSYSWTARLLVSKSIPFLTVYGGLGYNASNTNFDLKGHYKVPSSVPGISGEFVDPLTNSYTANGFLFNAGLRLKFGVFMLFGDYAYSDYNMFSAGLGITFR